METLKFPAPLLRILQEFAAREGTDISSIVRRWLDDRIRAERDRLREGRKERVETLYTCAIAWDFEVVPENAGYVEMYPSIKALKDDHPMWEECGIVRVEACETKREAATCLSYGEKREHEDAKKRRERFLVQEMLLHPSGIEVDVSGGFLCARRRSNGMFDVEWEIQNESFHKGFVKSDVENAARFFVEKRYELKLGYDFENREDEMSSVDDKKGKKRVVSTSTSNVNTFHEELEELLQVLGHPEAYVTDESKVIDFASFGRVEEAKKLAAEVARQVQVEISFDDLLWHVAERMREARQ